MISLNNLIQIAFTGVSCAFFAQFFNFAIYEVPYLKWYSKGLQSLPDNFADPLGNCPFCFAPWFFLLTYAIPETITQVLFTFGYIYAANTIFSRLTSE